MSCGTLYISLKKNQLNSINFELGFDSPYKYIISNYQEKMYRFTKNLYNKQHVIYKYK